MFCQGRFNRFIGHVDRHRSVVARASVVVVAKSGKLLTFMNVNELYAADLAE